MIELKDKFQVRTPLGDGIVHFVKDRGPGHHLEWTVAINDTGEFWTLPNPQVRRQTSITDGFITVSPFRDYDKEIFHWVPPLYDPTN